MIFPVKIKSIYYERKKKQLIGIVFAYFGNMTKSGIKLKLKQWFSDKK